MKVLTFHTINIVTRGFNTTVSIFFSKTVFFQSLVHAFLRVKY